MHQDVSEYQILADTIEALHTPRFTTCLGAVLSNTLTFDCAVILGHRLGKRPIYLYDSLQGGRDLLFKHYLVHAYLEDPFYLDLIESKQEGVFRYDDVARESVPSADYRKAFYSRTGWEDELCLAIKLEEKRWIAIYLGYLASQRRFSQRQVGALEERFELIASLCRQHWSPRPFHLSSPSTDVGHAGSAILEAVATFGAEHLSRREQQITSLLLQGLDSGEIAEYLGIAPGTVKNHRKRIYSQLRVNSLSELFRLFLNYAIAAPNITDL